MAGEELDLPNWNSALLADDAFDCAPPKQPLGQAAQRHAQPQAGGAAGLAWKAQPAAAAKPMGAPVPVLPKLPARSQLDAENEGAPAPGASTAAAAAEALRSATRRAHTPSRTGLSSKPVRLPSRLGLTPAAGTRQQAHQAAELFEVPLSAAATAPRQAPATGKNLKSILKRLNFSATKAKAAVLAVGAEAAPSTAAATRSAAPAGKAAAGTAARSTAKVLRFDAGVTPASAPRHVSFDASAGGPGAHSAVAYTPQPAIQEEGSEDGSDGAGASTVNSAAAGHTPFDRRLSSLFSKYSVQGGTPDLGEADLDSLVAGGAVRSPSWKRLSSASVPESIRELAKKYDSVTPPGVAEALAKAGAAAEPAAAEQAQPMEAVAGTPPPAAAACSKDASPALQPTPHEELSGLMQRNALYESPPVAGAAGAPAADAGAGPMSPGAAVAQLLAPVLLATIRQIDADKQAAAPGAAPTPAAAASSGWGSPAEFLGFPGGTPGAAGLRSPSVDGVPRDADGIPMLTPTTVTVRRRSSTRELGVVLEEGADPLAADLFDSFSPLGSGARAFSPGGSMGGFGSPAAAEEAPAAWAQQAEATPAGTAADGFSFFPAGPAAAEGAAADGSQGATPEMPAGAAAAAAAGGAAAAYVSPEILGFYEQRTAGAAAAGTAAGSSHAAASAAATPAMPRSILKSGRPLTEAGTPVLGHAQRAPADAAPPTITRELQALMSDLRLDDGAELEQMGTVSTLSPVRATGHLRGLLGGFARAITPVRRSARKKAPARPLEAMLEETGFSYVPNAAMMAEDAPPMREAAEAKAARKAASNVARSQADAALESTGASEPAEEVSSAVTPPGGRRRYSTRSAARAGTVDAAQGQQQEAQQERAAAATPEMPAVADRRLSLRRLRTPMQMAHSAAAQAAAAGTPQGQQLPAAGVPVAQDASPQLTESPSALAAAAAAAGARTLRPSTLKKARQSVGTPLPAGNENSSKNKTPEAGGGGKEGRRSATPQLSPTEQGIRSALRRSARKARTDGATPS